MRHALTLLASLALATITLFTTSTSAQNPTSNATDINTNCTIVWNTANGTGLFDVPLSNIKSTDPVRWQLAVNSPGNPSEDAAQQNDYDATIFLGTPQGVDFDDGSIGFSACAFHLGIPLNTIKRGQSDNGDCSQTLSLDCANALEARATSIAQSVTATIPITEQAGASSLVDSVCMSIEPSLTLGGWPAECAPYFVDESGNSTNSTSRYQLTYNDTGPSTCHIHPFKGPDNYTFTNAVSGFALPASGNRTADDASYDALMLGVWPLLTVLFPQANNSRVSPIAASEAKLTCIRATNAARGSRAVKPYGPPTPVVFPTPVASSSKLSAGAVGGIVVVVVVVVVLAAAGGALWCLRKHRRGRPYPDLYSPTPPGVKVASRTPWRQAPGDGNADAVGL